MYVIVCLAFSLLWSHLHVKVKDPQFTKHDFRFTKFAAKLYSIFMYIIYIGGIYTTAPASISWWPPVRRSRFIPCYQPRCTTINLWYVLVCSSLLCFLIWISSIRSRVTLFSLLLVHKGVVEEVLERSYSGIWEAINNGATLIPSEPCTRKELPSCTKIWADHVGGTSKKHKYHSEESLWDFMKLGFPLRKVSIITVVSLSHWTPCHNETTDLPFW